MIQCLFHCLKTDKKFKTGAISTEDLRGVWDDLQKEPFYKVVHFIHSLTKKAKEDIMGEILFDDN